MSSFGILYRVSTFGESHGIGVGCIIDGVPPGLPLTEEDVQPQLTRRRPGQSQLTTQRQEQDTVMILSGTENGITLGTPVALMVKNLDQRSFDYANTSTIPRPGHADYTYKVKYGIKSSSGGGRASARETIARVAAGAVAEKWLEKEYGTKIMCWVSTIGDISIPEDEARRLENFPPSRESIDNDGALWSKSDGTFASRRGEALDISGSRSGSTVDPADLAADGAEIVHTRCPHVPTSARMARRIREVKAAGDSIGGVATCVITSPPVGIGEPCFDKLEADLAKAMMSLPATKGFEIGSGFKGVSLLGSQHNDPFVSSNDHTLLATASNNAGGTLGGLSSGQPIVFRVAVKAVSSIGREQQTADFDGNSATLKVKGRHDPCVLPRTPPLVEGMAAIVIADATLRQRARAGPKPVPVLR